MIEIWLVRHGETQANAEGVLQGQSDARLSRRGEEQARILGRRLASHHFDLVAASDMVRATATAALAGLEARPDPAFRELDLGRWEGLTWAEAMARYPEEMRALMAGEDVPVGGGEAWPAFCARADAAVAGFASCLADGQRGLVLAHGGFIGAYMAGLLRFRGRSRPWPLEHPHNTAITVLTLEDGKWRVKVANDALHLGEFGPGRGTIVGLARHGESVANTREVWHGSTDGPLSERGRGQGAELAARYDGAQHVYTSGLRRARLTAEAFLAGRGGEPVIRPDLVEIDFGAWEGLTTAEIQERFAADWAATRQGQDLPRGGTGETVAGAAARLHHAVEEIAAGHPGERALVFTHGGIIRALVGRILGLGTAVRELLEGPENVSVTHLRCGDKGMAVMDYNTGVV